MLKKLKSINNYFMLKKFFRYILYSLVVLILNSCNNNKETIDRVIIDMEYNEVAIPKDIDRVACISQSATDLMIGFGLGDKIVGTYRSFLYNPWVYEIYPNSKNYKSYSYSVSAEELLKDNIQLVIIQDAENAESIKKAGIPVVAVHQYAVDGKFDDELFDTARIISEIFPESKQKIEKWINDVYYVMNEIKSKESESNTIYYINGEKAKGLYYSDGANSVIEYLLNITKQQLATSKYSVLNVHRVSDEEMIKLNPYAIIIGGAYQNKLLKELNDSPIWSSLECVKNNRVYQIPVCMVGIENISIETPIMMKFLANIFCDCNYDIHEDIQTTFKEYFNYKLTNQDISNMALGLSIDGKNMISE